MTEEAMDIRSEGKVNGVIFEGKRYIRFSFYDEDFDQDAVDWWIREPLDTLTRVREPGREIVLERAYSDAVLKADGL